MIRRALVLPFALAGCGQPAPEAADANAVVPAETGYIAKVKALSPGQRNGVLFRAIQAGGGPNCQGVAKVEDLPPSRPGQPNWRVTCSEGSEWAVSLGDDGTALVTGARAGG